MFNSLDKGTYSMVLKMEVFLVIIDII